MKITRENYEAYFIDFIEGNLSEKYLVPLEAFLEANPDLREELNLFEQTIQAPDPHIRYAHKSSLKKPTTGFFRLNTYVIPAFAAAAAIVVGIILINNFPFTEAEQDHISYQNTPVITPETADINPVEAALPDTAVSEPVAEINAEKPSPVSPPKVRAKKAPKTEDPPVQPQNEPAVNLIAEKVEQPDPEVQPVPETQPEPITHKEEPAVAEEKLEPVVVTVIMDARSNFSNDKDSSNPRKGLKLKGLIAQVKNLRSISL